MFQYAALRSMMLEKNDSQGIMCTKKLDGTSHNVFSLDYFNIDKTIIKNPKNCSFIGKICLNIYEKRFFKVNYKFMNFINYLTGIIGLYFVPDGYVNFKYRFKKRIKMVGYFQSQKYFDKHKDVIKKELKVSIPVEDKNKDILKKIEKSNSVCVHIRMGDFLGSIHQVCNLDYYLKAIQYMNDKVENPVFFIFSDNIKWAKDNIKNVDNIIFVDNNNVNYEDLRLMYSCKNFIMSNSSFSFWAQYLSENDNKIVVAPKRWYNEDILCDIYDEAWEII